MTIQAMLDLFREYDGLIIILIILAGLIKIPPLKINIWSWLITQIGDLFNRDLVERIEKLEVGSQELRKDLKDYISRTEHERADRARSRILRFSDEVSLEMKHSEEHYNEIMEDINKYEGYCQEHGDYKNNKAILAIEIIKESYQDCKTHHNFLVYKKKGQN